MTTTPYERSITYDRLTKDFKMELNGEFVGYAPNFHSAEVELNRVAYEMLTHGDFATATDLDGGAVECSEPDNHCAVHNPCPSHAADAARYLANSGIVVVQIATDPPPPEPNPLGDEEGDKEDPGEWRAFPTCTACQTSDFPPSSLRAHTCLACANAHHFGLANRFDASRHAVTLQSLLIDQTMRLCLNCGGEHRTWQCPQVARKLFAPAKREVWKDVALGRELARMRWLDFKAFVTLLMSVSTDDLIVYAASYQAFIRSYNPQSDMTINDVLQAWNRAMRDNRGPAAPALRLAA